MLSKSERRYKKTLEFSGFEGIPANGFFADAIIRASDYILHTECIVRVALQCIQVYNFF